MKKNLLTTGVIALFIFALIATPALANIITAKLQLGRTTSSSKSASANQDKNTDQDTPTEDESTAVDQQPEPGDSKDQRADDQTTPTPAPDQSEQPQPTPTQPEPTPPSEPQANWWSYPAEILPTSRAGDDLLVLVNKKYRLPSSYAPTDLVALTQANTNIRITNSAFKLRNTLIADLASMGAAAQAAGIDLSIISAYRSYNTQVSTYNYWVSYNGGNVDAADQVSARPGHSQHQLGTAMDFSSNEIGDALGSQFDNTAASAWLVENGWKYGFVISYPAGAHTITGYAHESWHYRYIGVSNAAEWKASGEILEVWLRGKNGV